LKKWHCGLCKVTVVVIVNVIIIIIIIINIMLLILEVGGNVLLGDARYALRPNYDG
jgi:hypothetical protein